MNKKTKLLSQSHPNVFDQASAVIQAGGVIAFPTDTVYGIGVSAFNRKAIEKIYDVKGRSHIKAIPILIGDVEDLAQITPPIPLYIQQIIDNFWPGALTLVLPMRPELPGNLSPGPTIGLRLPDHDQARRLLRETGPLAATSANLSGEPSALTADEVLQQLEGRIDLILDGGPVPGAQASTVLDCSGENLKVLREGPISLAAIHQVINETD
jgi:L-threonylcarbamoyladenylate synthase